MPTVHRDLAHITLEQLRLLPDLDRVEWLRSHAEGQWFDRKSARIKARTLAETMVAFANAEGGLICIGFEDRQVLGIAASGGLVNEWRQAAVNHTAPPVRHAVELLDCTNDAGRPDQIMVIEVETSERVHETRSHDWYLRIGDENRKLGPFEIQELRFDKGESTFDGGPVPGTGLTALDSVLVDRFLDTIRGAARPEVALRSRGLLVERDGNLVPTVAGILVLGREPQANLPNATLRLLRYHGSSRETGARSNIRDDIRLDGPLPAMISGAQKRLRRWLPRAIRLTPSGRFRGSGTLVPEAAWLESVVNAVTHRSYTFGDHISVELFEDRLEVESHGRLPGLVRPDNIRSTRFARNPRIARALADLRYGRELGDGVNRMFEEMERVGLPDPIYAQTAWSVRVAFLADPLSARVLALLPVGSERFVEDLSRTGRTTTSQAMQLLGASRPAVLRYLRRLEAQGLVEAVRMSPNDPRGFWRLRRASHDD